MDLPSTRTVPEDGLSIPLKWRNRVDLPAPLGPRRAMISPFGAWKLILFKASVPSGYW